MISLVCLVCGKIWTQFETVVKLLRNLKGWGWGGAVVASHMESHLCAQGASCITVQESLKTPEGLGRGCCSHNICISPTHTHTGCYRNDSLYMGPGNQTPACKTSCQTPHPLQLPVFLPVFRQPQSPAPLLLLFWSPRWVITLVTVVTFHLLPGPRACHGSHVLAWSFFIPDNFLSSASTGLAPGCLGF